ncbi:unnamed protein product [Lymnaea stagnalis]|uniref:Vesicular, overexpressed in cancer, prosurvival protein 1 n=1 Tax=Lymnaea stagnalis TaxID=6523 RepID=A0AAV2H7C2_LYMST
MIYKIIALHYGWCLLVVHGLESREQLWERLYGHDDGHKHPDSVPSDDDDDGKLQHHPHHSSSIQCGTYTCYGVSPYCCYQGGYEGCCWESMIYQMWWFWLIWVIIFFLALACGLACWRRRRAQYRYVVMADSQYPGYGTVVHSNTTTSAATQGAPAMPPSGAVAPPGYYAPPGYAAPPSYSQPQKPPPYSGQS